MVEGFEYAPKPEFECQCFIYNEASERDCIDRFFQIIEDYKPFIITSFNGDYFDFPFILNRAKVNGLSMEERTGIFEDPNQGEFYGRYITHLDCLYWVDRDAFLP